MAEKKLPEDRKVTEEEVRKTLKGVPSQEFLDMYFSRPESSEESTDKTIKKKDGGSICARPTGKGFGKARKR